MANVSVDPWTWSSTAGSNQPEGADTASIDDDMRAIGAGVKSALENLSSVAGTNTITATYTGLTAYATGLRCKFIPANTNTGATTLNLTSLGAKNVFWNGAACVGGEIRQSIPIEVVYDGTQFHIVANGFNAPFLDTHPIAEGSSDATKKVRLEVDGLTTATTRVLTVADNDGTILTTGNGQATQSDQETATSTTTYVTPGRQQYHPSASKGWLECDNAGNISASHNVTSISDDGTGVVTVTWNVDFSSANYCVLATPFLAGTAVFARVSAIAAGTCSITVTNVTPANADPTAYMIVAFGDQ